MRRRSSRRRDKRPMLKKNKELRTRKRKRDSPSKARVKREKVKMTDF